MLRRIVLFLLRQLQENLDPDLKARLDQYRADRAKLEAQVKAEQEAIAGIEGKLADLNAQRAALQTQLAEAERESNRIEEERKGVLNEKTNGPDLSDHDALSGRL
mgnify:CR=1 FL=1